MKNILSLDNMDVLANLAWSRVILAFDFDGTLAPIVADRDRAVMREQTRALFSRVCQLYACAVISGRRRTDVAARLTGIPTKYIVGNHGAEPGIGLEELKRDIDTIRPRLQDAIRPFAGLDIEDKRFSLAVHYRNSRSKRAARAAIQAAVSRLPIRMRLIGGKLVMNVVPIGAPTKADALLRVREAECADNALYVGDDTTDEDVFVIGQPDKLLTVRVGPSRSSDARYYLRDQRTLDVLLARLVVFREDRAS